jgi:hypothetical protein
MCEKVKAKTEFWATFGQPSVTGISATLPILSLEFGQPKVIVRVPKHTSHKPAARTNLIYNT